METTINPARIFGVNNNPIKTGNVIYFCEREIRVKDNPALQFSIQKSKELNLPLQIIHPKTNYNFLPKQNFIDEQIDQALKTFHNLNLDFKIIDKTPSEIIGKIRRMSYNSMKKKFNLSEYIKKYLPEQLV